MTGAGAQAGANLRIATWNLELPHPRSTARNARRLDMIREIDADIWILTETHDLIDLSATHRGVVTNSSPRKPRPGLRCGAIWCRKDWPTVREIPTSDPSEAVCAEIQHPAGHLLVYGSIIAYHGYTGPNHDSPQWAEHYRFIDWHRGDWQRLRGEFPQHHMVTGGDYNQARDGVGKYGTQHGRDLLSAALQAARLSCVTAEDFTATRKLRSRHNIDHICVDDRWAGFVSGVGAWEGIASDGTRLSDHNGVWVDLAPIS